MSSPPPILSDFTAPPPARCCCRRGDCYYRDRMRLSLVNHRVDLLILKSIHRILCSGVSVKPCHQSFDGGCSAAHRPLSLRPAAHLEPSTSDDCSPHWESRLGYFNFTLTGLANLPSTVTRTSTSPLPI